MFRVSQHRQAGIAILPVKSTGGGLDRQGAAIASLMAFKHL